MKKATVFLFLFFVFFSGTKFVWTRRKPKVRDGRADGHKATKMEGDARKDNNPKGRDGRINGLKRRKCQKRGWTVTIGRETDGRTNGRTKDEKTERPDAGMDSNQRGRDGRTNGLTDGEAKRSRRDGRSWEDISNEVSEE